MEEVVKVQEKSWPRFSTNKHCHEHKFQNALYDASKINSPQL